MSYGTIFASPIPTPGVTPSPTFEAQLVAWMQEAEAKLEQKIGQADVILTAGDVSHANRSVELPAAGATGIGATYDAANGYWSAVGGTDTVTFALSVQPGERIRSVSMHGRNLGTLWTFSVHKIAKSTGTITQLGTVNSGTSSGTIEKLTLAFTEACVDDVAYVARWTAGLAANRCLGVRLEVDRP